MTVDLYKSQIVPPGKTSTTQVAHTADAAPVSEKRSLGDPQRIDQTLNVAVKKQRRDDPGAPSGATLSSDAQKQSCSEHAADAAEKRKAASLSRGIGDVARAEATAEASKSRNTRHDDELFGAAQKQKLRQALEKSRRALAKASILPPPPRASSSQRASTPKINPRKLPMRLTFRSVKAFPAKLRTHWDRGGKTAAALSSRPNSSSAPITRLWRPAMRTARWAACRRMIWSS